MAIIELEEMEFYAYHGCFKEEQVVGNRFLVHVWLHTDISVPAESDSINDAVNYVEIYSLIKKEMAITSHLLEHVGSRMVKAILLQYNQVQKVVLKVSKVNPPMGGKMKQVSLIIERDRTM